MQQTVSVIIPTMKGREELLKRLLDSIPKGYETITIDDDSMLLAAKRNFGASLAQGDLFLFIDDDNYLEANAIENMVRSFNDNIGVMGMVACYDDKKKLIADGGSKRWYLSGFTWGVNTNKPLCDVLTYVYKVDEVANAFMISRRLFESLGGLDEENFPIDLDEADFCKRAKNVGYKIVMNPKAICYHRSITYSHIPNFRRPMNAYCMGNHRIRYQRKHLNALSFGVFSIIFCPIFVCFYTASLVWKRNPRMIVPFLKGVIDGFLNRRTNQYQKR